MKFLVIALLATFFSLSCATADEAVKPKATLEAAVAKKEQGLKEVYLHLEQAAKDFEKGPNPKKLAQSLKHYAEIFKYDRNYFIVEMFVPIYQNPKLKTKLHEALIEALPLTDREEFLERIGLAIKAETEGNG